jgi:cyclase
MLKTRVIPTLLVREMGLVKGTRFESWRRVGPLLPAVKVYELRDVDEMVVLDVEATTLNRPISPEVVREIAIASSVPLSVGGGIRSVEEAEALFQAGTDRIVLNSACYRDPSLIELLASRYGSQSVVISIDARHDGSAWVCWSESARRSEGVGPVSWARQVQELGAGEILLTSIDHEGLMAGLALDLIAEVCAAVGVPVIASGGAGSVDDLRKAVTDAGATAVAAGSLFHFTAATPETVKQHLEAFEIPVRRGVTAVEHRIS